jgi:uroporphyrinogen decarboxylase
MIKKQNKKLIRALNGEVMVSPPFWFMRQAGRYLPEYRKVRAANKNFLELCYNPDLAVEVTLQPLQRLKTDAAIMFSDILVIPDALGQKVEFKEGEGPVLEPIRNVQEIKKLNISGIHDHLSPVYEIINRLSKEIPKTTCLIGFAGGPWTLAIYMVEGKGGTECGTARVWAYKDPHGFQILIDLLIKAVSIYLIKQVDAGAEVLQLFDSWAGVLSEDQYRRWIIEPNKKIVENVRAIHPEVQIIGFPRNAGSKYKNFVHETRMDGISIDHSVSLEWAREELQPFTCVQGNLDNHTLLAGGDALENSVYKILETLSEGPFVFNLGHGILPQTPPENVERVAELVRNWRG